MRSPRVVLLLVLLITTARPAGAIAVSPADLSDHYVLPLTGDVAVVHRMASEGNRAGAFELARVSGDGRSRTFSFSTIVENVETIGTAQQLVFGKAADGYFLLDTAAPATTTELALTAEDWAARLKQAGIVNTGLQTPNDLALKLPESTLFPWRFRVMAGRFGLNDGQWSLAVQIAGAAVALVGGIVRPRARHMTAAMVLLGIAVNVVAQLVIAGGGPGAFVGFFALPVAYAVIATVGQRIGESFRFVRPVA